MGLAVSLKTYGFRDRMVSGFCDNIRAKREKETMKNSAKVFLTVTALCPLLPALAFASPIITNGSFEAVEIGPPFTSANPTDIPGWTHGGTPGDGFLWAIGYSDDGGGSVTTAGAGRQFVTLGGGTTAGGSGVPDSAAWSTTITGLTAGASYVLSFMTATELGTGGQPGGPQTMTVGFLSGSSTSPQSFTSPVSSAAYWRTWVTQDYTFLATNSSAIVNFSVTNQTYDMGLDNVSISAATPTVPEPSSLLLVGPVLLGLAGVIRRKLTFRTQ
jgi:PEP-CTERM motif